MNLNDYFTRIKFEGPVSIDLDCLSVIHCQHLLHIPYENIDVLLRKPLDMDMNRIFEKIVNQSRGGWCYEMNGLLGWALEQCGFEVMRMVGAVGRKDAGDDTLGNHLVLGVQLDQTYIVDVGLGDGLVTPIPLREGEYVQGDRTYRLEALYLNKKSLNEWRFHNSPGTLPPDFDFTFGHANEEILKTTCDSLQSDPESVFRNNLIVERLLVDGMLILYGRVLIHITKGVQEKTLLDSAAELTETLTKLFGLDVPEIEAVWPAIVKRHEVLFG